MTQHTGINNRFTTRILDYARRLARHQGSIMLAVALFIWAWVLIYALMYHQPRYTSDAMVIIRDSAVTARYVDAEQYYAAPTTSSSSANPVLNTMGLMESAAISEALLAYMQDHHPDELARLNIRDKRAWEAFFADGSAFIKTKNRPGTDLITVRFTWTKPLIAQEGLAVVLQAFQEASLTLNQSENANKSDFLAAQETEIADKLAAVREQKSAFKQKMDTVSLKREADELAATRILLGNTLADVNARASGKATEVRRYEQMLGMSPSAALQAGALGQNATMAKLHDELYRLTQQEAMLKSSLVDENPKVLEISAQIEQVKRNIAHEAGRTLGLSGQRHTSIADTTRGGMVDKMVAAQADAMRLGAESAVLRQRLGQINASIQKLPHVERELASLEQQEASLADALDTLRQKLLEARMQESQTMSNVFVVDAPRLPSREKFPTSNQLLLLGLLAGVFGGLGSGILKDRLENRKPRPRLEWGVIARKPQPTPVARVQVSGYPVLRSRPGIQAGEPMENPPSVDHKGFGSFGAVS